MTESAQDRADRLSREYVERGDPTGWFEALYLAAEGDAQMVPWAQRGPNPNVTEWIDRQRPDGRGQLALVIGCGLGFDAEALQRCGYDVTAFDISPTAIEWCRRLYPPSGVTYVAADLFDPPVEWLGGFDFVLESYTVQALDPLLHAGALKRVASFPGPDGGLLLICRGRDDAERVDGPPWPLSREDLGRVEASGLVVSSFEDYLDRDDPPVRRFRVCYQRSSARR